MCDEIVTLEKVIHCPAKKMKRAITKLKCCEQFVTQRDHLHFKQLILLYKTIFGNIKIRVSSSK